MATGFVPFKVIQACYVDFESIVIHSFFVSGSLISRLLMNESTTSLFKISSPL
jgi:hypothetical protein